MNTLLISHPDCELHEIAPGHPESPARVGAIVDALKAADVFARLNRLDAPRAAVESLLLAHPEAYVSGLFDSAPKRGRVQLDPDTAMNPHSLDAALRAVGSGVMATDRVIGGAARNAFCLVRPPGHHAERVRSMGFCLFGNIAIAARHAIREHGLTRVAIVDFDVHHGNGTEDIVDNDPHILFCSSFQYPFYPGGYRESVPGSRVNVPLAAGTGSADFRDAISRSWLPALENFRPEMVLISAGFDAHVEDPLAGLTLGDDDYRWITQQLVDVADRHAGGRLVSMLEGGYALGALGRAATLHVQTLLDA